MEIPNGLPLRSTPLKGLLQKNLHATDILWCLILVSVFIKSIIFLGLTLDQTHTTVLFKNAWNIADRHFAFYFGFVALPLSLAFLFKSRGRLRYLMILNVLVSFLFLVDLWYFRAFNTMPTALVLKESPNLNNLTDSIISMTRRVDLVFVCDFLLFIPMALAARKHYKTVSRSLITFLLTFLVAVGFIVYTPIKLYFNGANVKYSIIYMYDSTITSQNLSPLGYQLYSVYTFFSEGKNITLTAAEKDEVRKWFADKQEALPDNQYKGMFAGKNLLVIQVESLEKFVINQKYDGQEITPNLNRLLSNSMYFSDVHEQVHEGNTIDAELMGNTSVYPLKQGSTSFLYPYNLYNNSLPKMLQRRGYFTSDIQPDEGSFWNWMPLMKAIGFQKCMDNSSFVTDQAFGMGISDESFLKQVEPVIVHQKQPFYTFMITMSNHTPYNLPTFLRELKLPESLDSTYLGGYLQSVHYTDKHLGIFLDSLKKDGILDNTVVVIYGDHEGIHKYFPDSLEKVQPSEDWWMNNNKETPLIISGPGMKSGEIATTGGEVDILPTISYLMGIDQKEIANTAMGRNLLNTKKSFAVLEGGVYTGETSDAAQKAHDIKGLDIADMIIRSNYFSNNK